MKKYLAVFNVLSEGKGKMELFENNAMKATNDIVLNRIIL